MKKCSVCKKIKDTSQFNKNHTKKDGLSTFCRDCSHARFAAYYVKNRTKQLRVVRERNSRVRIEVNKKIFDILSHNKCVDCGEDDPIVLDFDHTSNKKFTISQASRLGKSWNNILLEIQKCKIRCANCHRRKTSKQFGWWKTKMGASLNGRAPGL